MRKVLPFMFCVLAPSVFGSCTSVSYPNSCYAYTSCPQETCCPASGCATALSCICQAENHGGATCCSTSCSVNCYSTPAHDCDQYYECKSKIGAPSGATAQFSIANKNGRQIPIVVGYNKDVASRGGISIDGIRARFENEEIGAMQGVGVGPIPSTQRFLNFWWSVSNNTPREITALVGEIQLDWVDKATGKIWSNAAMFAKDYWQGEKFTLKPGTLHEEVGGKVINGDGAIKVTVVINFVEFADGDRVGEEFLLSAHRAERRAAFRELLEAHASIQDSQLLAHLKPPAEDYDRTSMWGYLSREAERVGLGGLIAKAESELQDWRYGWVDQGVKKFAEVKAACNARAKR